MGVCGAFHKAGPAINTLDLVLHFIGTCFAGSVNY